jgi:AcrR family transcriptional regulator
VVGETKSNRAEAEFKAAARRVFARQGYAPTKITDITTEAGRAAGGIYRYFESKAAVLKALADDFIAALHERVAGRAGHAHAMTTAEHVREHVEAYWKTYREFLPEMVAIYQASMSDPVFAGIWEDMRDRDVAIWSAHFRELRAHHGKSVEDAPRIAVMTRSLLEQHCYTVMLGAEVGDNGGRDDAEIEALARFVYGGALA